MQDRTMKRKITQCDQDDTLHDQSTTQEPNRERYLRCISEILDQGTYGSVNPEPATMNRRGKHEDTIAFQHGECEKGNAPNESSGIEERKSNLWRELKEELFFNPRKTGLFILFSLVIIFSLIFCAIALKYGLNRNKSGSNVVPPLTLVDTSPFPTISPSVSTSHLRNTAPSAAPSRSMQLFSPTLYAPILDPTGCPRHPTPAPLPGKKGVAFTLRPEGREGSWIENLPKVQALNGYWNYNWAAYRIDAQPMDMEFTPMIWGPWTVPEFIQDHVLPQIQSRRVKRLLGFNEPDKENQANMSVDQAIQFWPLLEETGLSLVSPSCVDPLGTWMEEFMDRAVELCYRVDWIGVHWYGGPNVNNFKTRMQAVYEKYGKPILITEFAPADWSASTVQNNRHSAETVLNFAKEAIPWLEEQPWVMGYAWFSFEIDRPEGTSSALFNLDGTLTPLGQYYASVRT
ncbi:hypothetical protein FisN_24Lh168 [Fistulifera solaris]|uniref:Asl1-like glycosyl hydrolase catalytic domain-containing protein n=1 Tax=Fistulifera solaris TaxID=1519565 RepID=A0A1Z5K9U5_FISSO|nr:hypothetical protein FisN_24Lh168 [Fistulifera solaris]|eukprot:GAX22881.1 hypothetical protein FisN_24Lh168 [Fistulifera solaris]